MEQRPRVLTRFFSQVPKTILYAMSPILMLLGFLAWFVLGEAVITVKKSPAPVTLMPS